MKTVKRRRRKQQPITPARQAELKSMNYRQYLASPEWRRRRFLALRIAKDTCSACGRPGPGLEVHHLSYEHRGAEPMCDLRVLCSQCHRSVHSLV